MWPSVRWDCFSRKVVVISALSTGCRILCYQWLIWISHLNHRATAAAQITCMSHTSCKHTQFLGLSAEDKYLHWIRDSSQLDKLQQPVSTNTTAQHLDTVFRMQSVSCLKREHCKETILIWLSRCQLNTHDLITTKLTSPSSQQQPIGQLSLVLIIKH